MTEYQWKTKVPVYGYVYHKDGTRSRSLAAYASCNDCGQPMLEIKKGDQVVKVNLKILYDQIRYPEA